METTHHQHNCDAQMTTLLGEVRNGVRFLVLQYALHQTRIAAVDPRPCCSTLWARSDRRRCMQMHDDCLIMHLDAIGVQRGREAKKRRKIDGNASG